MTESFARRSRLSVEAVEAPIEVVLRGGPVGSIRRSIHLGSQPLPEAIEIAVPTENGAVVLVYALRDQRGRAAEYELTMHSMHALTVAGATTD